MKKTIVLFDMDGTLTAPRLAFDRSLLPALSKLATLCEIGIVSGSDHNYIHEQMKHVIEKSEVRYRMHLLPCNGTKHYSPPKDNKGFYTLDYEVNMKSEIGEGNFNSLMKILFERQLNFSHSLPCFSGNFIDYRGSMVNWCPIGRSASPSERKAFVDLDTSYSPSLRKKERSFLLNSGTFRALDLSVKIGGDTSFDIFPKRWDKTFSLKHFPDYNVWFVGDRCYTDGNDEEIYEHLFKLGRAFSTSGPTNTLEIIEDIIIPQLKQSNDYFKKNLY
jgi:phosphomannomutase